MNDRFEVVIPAAGRGMRFFPVTTVVPKELLPIMNIPAIDFITRECVGSAVSSISCVIHPNKESIVDYVRKQSVLFATQVYSVYQTERLGLGHAVLQAEGFIKEDFFGVLLPDDLIFGDEPLLKRLKRESEIYDASVIAIRAVPIESVSSYGIIDIAHELESDRFLVKNIVEKPKQIEAPSRYAVIGRYLLHRAVFQCLKQIRRGHHGEYQLTDALQILLRAGHKIVALNVTERHFDIGTPPGWLQAVNFYASASPKQLGFYTSITDF